MTYATGLTVTSPNQGDEIDIQNGLNISWTIDDNDNVSANVTIDLYLGHSYYMKLTPDEKKNPVPITDLTYTFGYTPDQPFISVQSDYLVRIKDSSASDFASGKFGIYNTGSRVTSVPSTAIPRSTRKASSQYPSASASYRVPPINATVTNSIKPKGGAIANAATGHAYGDMTASLFTLAVFVAPFVYTFGLLCPYGGRFLF